MSRIFRLVIFVSVLLAFLVSGCADDLSHRNVFDAGAGDAVISFSVEKVNLTRTEDSPQMESAIGHAYLLFYETDASSENAVPVAAVRAEVVEANPSALTFKMPLRLEPDKDYRLQAIANADDYVPEGFASFPAYLQAWCANSSDNKESLHLYRAESILTDNVSLLPMQGSLVDDVPFRFSMQNGSYDVSASLVFRRLVARIDVANIVKEGFVVEGVALCNWRDAVPVSSVDSQLGNRFGAVHGILSDDSGNSVGVAFVDMPLADDSGVQQLSESIYCFPSSSYDSYPSDNESTALIIKAKYGDDAESSYYRVNVGMTGNRSEVKANTKYLVTIRSAKGRGAGTPEEAYAAKESPIVLSVVEDWDLDGCFDMDDKGNFLLLSTGRLEFDGEVLENKEVKVRTSRGLAWNAEYIADGDLAVSAFSATKLSESSLAIGPTGENMEDEILSGKFIVSAQTPEGGRLSVEVAVIQNKVEDRPYEPVIPDNLPFALIPTEGERVKIDHDARTIEIDGFDPDCFNSFIDVPFKVYVKDAASPTINISSTLLWPLEGRISLDTSSLYTYRKESYNAQGTGQVSDGTGNQVLFSTLYKSSISVKNEDVVHISVGGMAPDDPAIEREITLSSNGETIKYQITVKPRPCIIDDVILTDEAGDSWLIQDRNIADLTKAQYLSYIGLDADEKKYQAYNYSFVTIFNLNIPFKKKSENELFNETFHEMFRGKYYSLSNSSALVPKSNSDGDRITWLKKFISSSDRHNSRFYKEENYQDWIFPNNIQLDHIRSKIRVSKMRMYLVSDISIKDKKQYIPICCYLPYHCYNIDDDSNITNGYFSSTDGITPDLITILSFGLTNGEIIKQTKGSTYMGLCRLVRPLTEEELEDYKKNYLGYGSQPHRLTICHPDTYESTPLGWISN